MATKKPATAKVPENDHNDVVIIELDRPRELKFGHKALKRFSAMRGCSIMHVFQDLENYDAVTCAAYCMLAADDPDLTVGQVDELLEEYNDPVGLYIKVTEAVTKAFPHDDDDENGGENPQTAAGTGVKA